MQKVNPNLYTPIAIIVAGIVVAAAVLILGHWGGNGAPAPATTQPSATANVNAAQIVINNDPMIGDANAPLTIDYWFDYQCPFCKENEVNNMPLLIKDYVDTGKVKLIFKDFSFLGPDSVTLGQWARAVWAVAPTEFETWHAAIFQAQGTENSGWATAAEIQKVTASVLTAAQTDQVRKLATQDAATQYKNEMNADYQEGVNVGIQGTPALLIGNQLVAGYENYSSLSQMIDQQLSALSK